MGKAGKGPEHRASGGMRLPTPLVVQGLADQAVVAVMPLIIRRRSEGPVGMVVLRVVDRKVIVFSRLLKPMSFWSELLETHNSGLLQ